jgi:WD40 repeat protein
MACVCRHHNAQSAERIRQLEDAGQKMFRMVETLVQHSFAEHFAATSEVSVWTDRIPEDDEGEEPPVVLKALNTLSSQLRDLRDVFGPATRHDTTYRDVALSSALQDPITVKLNAVAASSAASNDEGTVAILGLSSPSSSSQQSFESANSPARQVRKRTLSPVLVDEVVMAEEPSGRGEEAICRYSHDGQRLVVACRGLQTIRVFDVDTVNHKAERELIQTDSPVVGADWIAQSHCLVHALEDGTITVWDTETKARTFIISYNADERRPSLLACARSSAIGAVALVSSEADQAERVRIQFFAFEDQAIRVVSSVELPKPTDLRSLQWANDGSALAVAESDGRVSLLSPSEARSLGSWRLGTGDAPLASITFGSDNQSLLAVEASGDRVAEWRIADLLATVTAEVPPSKSYRLPSQLVPDRETTRRQIEIQTARFTFAVSSCASSTASYWTVFTVRFLVLRHAHS